jgi:hypothetical protein
VLYILNTFSSTGTVRVPFVYPCSGLMAHSVRRNFLSVTAAPSDEINVAGAQDL